VDYIGLLTKNIGVGYEEYKFLTQLNKELTAQATNACAGFDFIPCNALFQMII
jgi:hypothetical protein